MTLSSPDLTPWPFCGILSVEMSRPWDDPEYYIYPKLSNEENAAYRRSRARVRREYTDKVKNQPCVDCGEAFPPVAMDFDHVRGQKEFQISDARSRTSFKKLQEEIAKCDIVCANCHRIRTQERLVDGG